MWIGSQSASGHIEGQRCRWTLADEGHLSSTSSEYSLCIHFETKQFLCCTYLCFCIYFFHCCSRCMGGEERSLCTRRHSGRPSPSSWLEAGSSSTARPVPPPAPRGAHHMLVFISGQRTTGRLKCRHCHAKTQLKCSSCDVPLCLIPTRDCYSDWHAANL